MVKIQICKMCGKEFETYRRANGRFVGFCSEECRKEAEAARSRIAHREAKERDFARNEMRKIETGKLDKTLDYCRRNKMSYAEWQKQQTEKLMKRMEINKMKTWILERKCDGEWYRYGEYGEQAIESLVRAGALIINSGQEIRIREGEKDG